RFLVGGLLAGKETDGLEKQQARRHPEKLRHFMRIRNLALRDLAEVGVGDSGERHLEDVDLLAFGQSEKKLQRSLEDWSADAMPGGQTRRRIFGAHAAHLRAQLLRCSLAHRLSDALAPLLLASPESDHLDRRISRRRSAAGPLALGVGQRSAVPF